MSLYPTRRTQLAAEYRAKALDLREQAAASRKSNYTAKLLREAGDYERFAQRHDPLAVLSRETAH
jgi:hypothetical protein